MKSTTCDLTGEVITDGVPNFGRGVHSFVVNSAKDITVNITFKGGGRGVITDHPQGIMGGQNVGGVNLSKAGLAAALALITAASVVSGAVSNAQSATNMQLTHVCDMTEEVIAADGQNYGRGTKTVALANTNIIAEVTFFKGNSGGVDLSAAGFDAAIAAAAARVSGITGTKASQTLTMTDVAVNNNTVTIGGQTYTFKTALTGGGATANEVLIGANQAASMLNLARAINKGAGGGTLYGSATVLNTNVTASNSGDTLVVTAKQSGTAANSVATTETLTNGSWGAATLAGGVASDSTGTLSGNHIASGEPGALTAEAPGVTRPD